MTFMHFCPASALGSASSFTLNIPDDAKVYSDIGAVTQAFIGFRGDGDIHWEQDGGIDAGAPRGINVDNTGWIWEDNSPPPQYASWVNPLAAAIQSPFLEFRVNISSQLGGPGARLFDNSGGVFVPMTSGVWYALEEVGDVVWLQCISGGPTSLLTGNMQVRKSAAILHTMTFDLRAQ